jgi:hypothetical protein
MTNEELLERLRRASKLFNPECHEAADEIESLRKQRDEALCEVYELREDRNTWKARYEWSIGERDKLLIQHDEALRQVAVLREALSWYVKEDDVDESNLDDRYWVAGKRRAIQILSEIPSPGVLCESEPVAYMNVKGDMTFLHGPYNADDIPLYRKKGESP